MNVTNGISKISGYDRTPVFVKNDYFGLRLKILKLKMNKYHFLAFDLGASSGRAMLGILENNNLTLKKIHRFKNQMMHIHGNYFWNIFSLFDELKTGLKKCISEFGIQPNSIGIDTWGVDYALLNRKGIL